ncbi:MAG: hypothetical protein PF569_01800 [Candidatus Woesearchaeota archaeon]|jgi:hypothetical protein|nr:hypothetical protein [Candidatus Woesearchaeota archaeon]
MNNYKLIKKLPFEDSPEIGYISTSKSNINNIHCWNFNWFDPQKYPEFWEEIVEQIPCHLHYSGDNVIGVTRLTDGIYFSKGLRIKMPNYDSIGFIYGFRYENNKLIINHTFSYLMNREGYKDHLKYLRPCLYTKEDLSDNKYETRKN